MKNNKFFKNKYFLIKKFTSNFLKSYFPENYRNPSRLIFSKKLFKKFADIFFSKKYPNDLPKLNQERENFILIRKKLEISLDEINRNLNSLDEKSKNLDRSIFENEKKLETQVKTINDIEKYIQNKDEKKIDPRKEIFLNKNYIEIKKIFTEENEYLIKENKINSELIPNINKEVKEYNLKLKKCREEITENNLKILEIDEKISKITYLKDLTDAKNNKIKIFFILFSPILIFAIYFYLVGRPRYFVVSDVVVRKSLSSSESGDGFTSLLGVGNQSSREDARFLKIYLESPQVLEDINKTIKFKEKYKKRGLDFFAGINQNISQDNLYEFFKKQIRIDFDEISGAIKIKTIAYNPFTSLKFNKFLIEKAEQFVNELNQSIYLRQIGFVENQVIVNFEKLAEAKLKLEEFQNQTKTINLNQEVLSATSLITSLEQQLADSKLQLSLLKRQFVDQNAPEINMMNSQIEELRIQIKEQRDILSDPDSKNYISRIGILNSLKSNLQFRNDIYNASLATSEKTKLDAQKQQRFMAILSKPTLPDDQDMNWKNRWFLTFTSIIVIGFYLSRFILGISDSHNS